MSALAEIIEEPSAEDWDFRRADTKQVTHGIHAYPAMMIPQVARRLLEIYGQKGNLLFDPYCGSGTTLLEGMMAGMTATGSDLNPLARLIARVKTTPVPINLLEQEIKRLPEAAPIDEFPMPSVPNVDYWFSQEIQRDLAALRQHIDQINNPLISETLKVAFSLTVRKVSWTRNSEFKLFRIPECQMATHNPDTFGIMQAAAADLRKSLINLSRIVVENIERPVVHGFNSVVGIPRTSLTPGSVDLVVTSPPYGDSRTTVAYGQFCRLSSQWLGYSDANQVDKTLMGGVKINKMLRFGFRKLDRAISDIATVNECRALEVAAFFKDYKASIRNVAETVRPGGHALCGRKSHGKGSAGSHSRGNCRFLRVKRI